MADVAQILSILENPRTATRGHREFLGKFCLRVARFDESFHQIYQILLLETGNSFIHLVIDEVNPDDAAKRFIEVRAQVQLAQLLFGWLDM